MGGGGMVFKGLEVMWGAFLCDKLESTKLERGPYCFHGCQAAKAKETSIHDGKQGSKSNPSPWLHWVLTLE